MAVAFIDFYLVTSDDRVIQLLPQRTYVFGRGDDADIQVQDTLTSRHHCELRWDDATFWALVDLGARNGTYCNNQRLSSPAILGDRDTLQVGGQRFTYRLLPPGSDPASLTKDQASAIGNLETFEVSAQDLLNDGAKPAFTGEVPDGDFKKLLRFFSLTNKSGRLDLAAPPERQVWLVDGVPRRALCGDVHGMLALEALIAEPGATFSFHEGTRVAREEWSITGERQHLLRDVLGATDLNDLGIDAADLARAERMQRHLLARLPEIPGYELGVYYEGKSGVSGDFYDVGVMPNGNVLVVLGDVAGHGVQAAMAVAGMLKTLRALRQSDRELADLLVALNDDIRQDLLPGQFITLFAALLTPSTGELTVALAGHHPGLHLCLGEQISTAAMGSIGTALGLFDNARFRELLSPISMTLGVGEGLLQYTDGILEAMDAKRQEYGDERLAQAVVRLGSSATAQQVVDGIVADTKAFAATIEDDLTLLALIRRASSSAPAVNHVDSTARTRAASTPKRESDTDTDLKVVRSSTPSPALTAAVTARDQQSAPRGQPTVTPPAKRTPGRDGDPWLGTHFGQVEAVCRISQGSMGMVYRGHHRLLQTDVAIKIMSTRDEAKAELHRQRFLREARAAARIRHPNVVQVMDVGDTDDQGIYLIMELVEGPNLARRLDEHGRMGDQELLPVARGIAEGLAAIHQLGIIHRDIKPDNILIDPLGTPKISDLGLARMVDEADAQGLTATGMVLGTPTYISPEAIRDSSSADAKSDIYSLGVTLYHLLAGRAPFIGKTISELMRSHLAGDHTPLRELAPHADARLCALIERCLDLDPKVRPTAGELALELGAAQQARVAAPTFVASQANAVPEMFRRQQQRAATPVYARPGVWLGVGIAVIVVVIAVVLVMNRQWFI
jgi:Protein kinase domain/Stage II sporulation protein E (SpoIIE)/FHA domain